MDDIASGESTVSVELVDTLPLAAKAESTAACAEVASNPSSTASVSAVDQRYLLCGLDAIDSWLKISSIHEFPPSKLRMAIAAVGNLQHGLAVLVLQTPLQLRCHRGCSSRFHEDRHR